MKKFPLLVISFLILKMSFANAYIPSGVQINELLWDANGDWQLELSYFTADIENFSYDSVVIRTSNFSYKLIMPVNNEIGIAYLVLNKSIVGDSLDFRSEGDFIFIKTYIGEGYISNDKYKLIYGDYEDSMISLPDEGKSIVLFEGLNSFYIISEKPTLGYVNSPVGALCRIQGNVYSANERILNGHYYFGLTFEFMTSINGTYYTYLLPGYHNITEVYYERVESIWWLDIKPLEFNINIDDTLDLDIHITDPKFVSVNELKEKQGFEVYPNPVSNKISIKSTEFIKYKTVNVQLIDIKGQEVVSFTKNSDEQITIDLESNVKAGIYILNIVNHNKLIYSQKVIVNPF